MKYFYQSLLLLFWHNGIFSAAKKPSSCQSDEKKKGIQLYQHKLLYLMLPLVILLSAASTRLTLIWDTATSAAVVP